MFRQGRKDPSREQKGSERTSGNAFPPDSGFGWGRWCGFSRWIGPRKGKKFQYTSPVKREQMELDELKKEAKFFEDRLEEIRKRIEELEAIIKGRAEKETVKTEG